LWDQLQSIGQTDDNDANYDFLYAEYSSCHQTDFRLDRLEETDAEINLSGSFGNGGTSPYEPLRGES